MTGSLKTSWACIHTTAAAPASADSSETSKYEEAVVTATPLYTRNFIASRQTPPAFLPCFIDAGSRKRLGREVHATHFVLRA